LGAFAAARADDEALLFTPEGFNQPGLPRTASGDGNAHLRIIVRNKETGEPTFCRVNVVGPDGHYYQPKQNYLTPFALTGEWPKSGKGNRQGKGPFRYLGRFFYSWGDLTVDVPPGRVRVEVWKGIEFLPEMRNVTLAANEDATVDLTLSRPEPMAAHGYYSGDPHLHFPRQSDADDQLVLDLLEAEDVRFGSVLAYNEPAGPYNGVMQTLDSPQTRGLGIESLRSRGDYHIVSGQEYRSTTHGHLNLFLRKNLVLEGKKLNADDGPPYGLLARETRDEGGFAFYAHGGYAQAIYADAAQGDIDGVELLQFAVYRGIELADWYRFLNVGYRFPAIGASDFPACRFLSDCRTYVLSDKPPDFREWLAGCRAGRSFMTTGPLLLLEVNGHKPGDEIKLAGPGPHKVKVRVRLFSNVTPDVSAEVICNGKVVGGGGARTSPKQLPQRSGYSTEIELTESCWIAARAYSATEAGNPDAEAHTNPVYVTIDGKAPYDRDSLDKLVEKLDGQIAAHKKRDFASKADIVDYFERSRDILLKIRAAGGVPAGQHPAKILEAELPTLDRPGARTHTDEELKAYLQPVPPKSPREALETFETVDDFHLELVASEPNVVDPVAAAFDENGVLYVAEMRDYPYFPQPGHKPLGTVRRLEDTDGDGVFDRSTIFADELLWAAGIAPWKGGLFVAAPPDIWYLRDTDGDGRADTRRKVFTGFGVKNQQAMLNNLQFGLDHKIYGTTAGNGGMVRPGEQPNAAPVSVDGRDFRFDPVGESFESITGTVQFGNTFDDWGNRFLCSESRPLLHSVLPQHYLARNPYLPVPEAIHNIAGGSVPIFRISPIERWRHVRSSRRIAHNERGANSAGASHHVVDAGAGVTVYRGDAYPEKYYGSVFIGDAQNNLVHRMVLAPSGVTFTSQRGEPHTEFVRSSDNWFRPVNFVHAPDGTLYVLDMSREILESIHIPLDVLKFLDLKSGRDRGRIYRIAPPGFRPAKPPRLSQATTAELVRLLEHRGGWWRDTAHRLIFERQDPAAVPPLEQLARESESPQARLHALWSLEGLGALSPALLVRALADEHPAVREHSLVLAESRLDQAPALLNAALPLADDSAVRVRFQAAFTLGASHDPRAAEALARIARRDAADSWLRTAVMSSVTESAPRMLALLAGDARFAASAEGRNMLAQLAFVVGARNRSDEVRQVLEDLGAHHAENESLARHVLLSLGDGLRQSGAHLTFEIVNAGSASSIDRALRPLIEKARAAAVNDAAAEAERVEAVRLLGILEYAAAGDLLVGLLQPREPQGVQLATVQALAGHTQDAVAEAFLTRLPEGAPEVRVAITRALLSRAGWTEKLLSAAREGTVSLASLDAAQRSLLLEHSRPAIRALAQSLFGADAPNPRKEVLAAYQPVLRQRGDAAAGRKVFDRECLACHRVGDRGHVVGPSLASSSAREPAALLTHVLDPNQYVLPDYVQYVIVDTNGRSYAGLIAAQTATSVTLKRDQSATDTILRNQIDQMVSTGKSLMPEGLEKKISPAEMADLLAYLADLQASEPAAPPRLDIGTEPGLVEPDR